MSWQPFASALLVLIGFVAIPAAAAVCGQMLFQRIVSRDRLIPHHEVAGFLVAIVGVLYAVVLGFVVVTSWSAFDAAQQTADVEAGYVGDAFGFAAMLPEPRREHMRRTLAQYAIEVRDHEWEALSHGHQDRRARALMVQAIQTLGEPYRHLSETLDDALNRETTRQAVAASLRDIADSRRLRVIQAQKTFSAPLALALLIGALMLMIFVFLFGVEDRMLQFTMTAIVAGCIGLLLGVVFEFSAPYSGVLRVSPDAWTYIIVNNQMERVAGTR